MAPVNMARRSASSPDMDIPAEWWQVFHSEPLNRLVQDSLAANPTLAAAQAALRQADENTLAQKGFYYPSSRRRILRQPQPDPGRSAVARLGPRQSRITAWSRRS